MSDTVAGPSVHAAPEEYPLLPSQIRAMNGLPLHIAARVREAQLRDAALIQKADQHLRPLVPIVLALARIAAVEDLTSSS